jgi:O-antigen biosynthesis protein WbqP
MKKIFDFVLAVLLILMLFILIMGIAFLVRLTSRGPAIYWSKRIGKNNEIFLMPKFRTMHIETPTVATHLLRNPEQWITPVGSFLRKYSLDELPQLWSILVGDMSFVGPRPALYNQKDLITKRTEKGVHKILPGLTGWAQINGRDELSVVEKLKFDVEYLERRTLMFDVRIIWITILKVFIKEGISH